MSVTIATPALALLPAAPASQVSPAAPATALLQSQQTPTDLAALATELAAVLSGDFSEFSALLSESGEFPEASQPVFRQIRFQELLGFAEPRAAWTGQDPRLAAADENRGEPAGEPEQIELPEWPRTAPAVVVFLPQPAAGLAEPSQAVSISGHRLTSQESRSNERSTPGQASLEPISFALQLRPAPRPAQLDGAFAEFHLAQESQPDQSATMQVQGSDQAVARGSQPQEALEISAPPVDRAMSQAVAEPTTDAGASGREEHPDQRPRLRLPLSRPRTGDTAVQPLDQTLREISSPPGAAHSLAPSAGSTAGRKESTHPPAVMPVPTPPTAAASADPGTIEHARPVREIQLEIGPAGSPEVRLRVLERGGDVVVLARSADQTTSHQLGERLSELTTRLSSQGFETESWTPAPELGSSGETREVHLAGGKEGDSSDFNDQRQPAEGFGGGHGDSRRRRGMPAWLEAIEQNLDGQGAQKGAQQ